MVQCQGFTPVGALFRHNGNQKLYVLYHWCKVRRGVLWWKRWVDGVVYRSNEDPNNLYVRTLSNFTKRFTPLKPSELYDL